MYNLFLDDIRQPSEVANYINPIELKRVFKDLNWIIVRSYEEFIDYISNNGLSKIVSFDHDLADINYNSTTQRESFTYHEKTGYDCAKWLIQYCLDNNLQFPEWYCHSLNPIGKKG